MDQPAGLVSRMTKLGSIYEAMHAYRKCDRNLSKLKDKRGKQAWQTVIRILKVLQDGDND